MSKNSTPPPAPHTNLPPATEGNPAYPDLKAREKVVKANTGKHETVKKLPAAKLHEAPDQPTSN